MLRYLIFAVSFALLVTSLSAVFDYWRYEEVMQDVGDLMLHRVSSEQIAGEIEAASAEDRPEDARMYLSIAGSFGYQLDPEPFLPGIEALETPWQVARRRVTRFADGFIDGEADTAAGVAGAMAADFTVIGDARDLYEQYQISRAGGDVNELIVTLAGVGVGLTAVTVASSGSAAPVKAGSSVLKLAARTGRMTARLQRMLLHQGRQVFDYKGFLLATRGEKTLDNLRQAAVKAYNPRAIKALGETTSSVNNIRKSTSLLDAVDMLRYVETADDLRRLERVSSRFGKQTKGILKLLGKTAIGTVRVLRHTTELLIGIIASVFSMLAAILSVGSFFRSGKRAA